MRVFRSIVAVLVLGSMAIISVLVYLLSTILTKGGLDYVKS